MDGGYDRCEAHADNSEDLELRALHARLENWRRWLRKRDYLPQGYRTLMGLFLARSLCASDGQAARQPVDEADAVIIEKAVHRLPERNRDALILHWLWQYTDGVKVRRNLRPADRYRLLGVRKSQYYAVIRKSEIMLKNLLR